MANYIDDIGGYQMDALLVGTKDTGDNLGDYDYDETTKKCVWFSSTGTSSTGLTLPNSPFIVYEVYEYNSYTNPLTGTNVYRWIEYTTDIGTIATTLSDWQTAFDTVAGTDTYSVKATHYKGSDKADVYIGSDTVNFPTTADSVDREFTGYDSEWVLSDTLFADSVIDPVVDRIFTLEDYELPSDGTGGYTFNPESSDPADSLYTYITVGGATITKPTYRGDTDIDFVDGTDYIFSFDAVYLTSGDNVQPYLKQINDGDFVTLDYYVTQGKNEIQFTCVTGGTTRLYFYFDGRKIYDLNLTNIKVHEVI